MYRPAFSYSFFFFMLECKCRSIPLIMLLLAGTTSCSCWIPAEDQWRRQYCKVPKGIYDLDCYPLLATCSLRGGSLKRRKTTAESNATTVVNGSNTIKRRMEWMLPPNAAKIDSRASSKSMSKPAYGSDSVAKSSLEHMRSDVHARLPAHLSKQQQVDQQLRHLQVRRLYYNFLFIL